MQTWLPHNSFTKSARLLDYRRLGKQRVECKQILEALRRNGGAWYNHPATQMWKNYEPALCLYALLVCEEWVRRGYRDTLTAYFESQYSQDELIDTPLPPWHGDDRIHSSHRGRLLMKAPEFYSQYGWTDAPVEKTLYERDLRLMI